MPPTSGPMTEPIMKLDIQMAMAVVLDHYGLLGLPRHEVSLQRIAGLLLVVAGVVLVRRG